MNKKMRELYLKIEQKTLMAKGFLEEGENKDLTKAESLLNEVDVLKKEFELEKKRFELEKEENTPSDKDLSKKYGVDSKNTFRITDKAIYPGERYKRSFYESEKKFRFW